jgi:hypothetical protein
MILERVPLALEEMPNGWRETPAAEDRSDLIELSPPCDVFDPGVVFPGALATAGSPSFVGLTGQQWQSFGAVYGSGTEAKQVVDQAQILVDRCGDEYKDAIRKAAEDQLEALGISLGFLADIDVSLEPHNAPPLGDNSAGYRVAVNVNVVGQRQTFAVDLRIFSTGTIVAASAYSTFGSVNESEEQDINARLLASVSSAPRG